MELTRDWVLKRLPVRLKDANKGTFGKVLALAGSKNYPGAAYLACAACYRVGAGLVTLAAEESIRDLVFKKLPEATYLSYEEMPEEAGKYDVLLIGSGLGQERQAKNMMELLLKIEKPKVIDGDGLNILAEMKWFAKINGKSILTPHPGEMARLTGLSVDEIQISRAEVAKNFAKERRQVIVLKGANTVIASPGSGEGILISPFANPALATAGTGDILTGVISGLMAQGLAPYDAAGVGVYIHGKAGELVAQKVGKAGSLASDLLPLLPQVIKDLL